MKTKGRTDPEKITLIRNLKGVARLNEVKIWSILASELSRPNRQRVAVNLSHLNRVSKPGDILLIPGKVLGAGFLNHKIEVAAESFSISAKTKINRIGGQCLTIEELIAKNPKGNHVRLIK